MSEPRDAATLTGGDVGRLAAVTVDGQVVTGRIKSVRFDEPLPHEATGLPVLYLTLDVAGLTLFGRVDPTAPVDFDVEVPA